MLRLEVLQGHPRSDSQGGEERCAEPLADLSWGLFST